MKTKKEKREWILKNCVNNSNTIVLDELDFSGYTVDISNMKADKIIQSGHAAKVIVQSRQVADSVMQDSHIADHISQGNHSCKTIMPQDLRGYECYVGDYREVYYEFKRKNK